MSKITLYISHETWRNFRIACLAHDTSASKEVERLMLQQLMDWKATGAPLANE